MLEDLGKWYTETGPGAEALAKILKSFGTAAAITLRPSDTATDKFERTATINELDKKISDLLRRLYPVPPDSLKNLTMPLPRTGQELRLP